MPPPDIIDHAPVVAPPPIVAPVKIRAEGDPIWQTELGPAASTVGAWLTVIVFVALTAMHGPAPSGSSEVSVNVIVPVKPAAGVKVTAAGLFVGLVLLSVPVPDVIDQVPVVAPPPILAPVNVIAPGVAD
jgi:hypothetical protein